MKFNIEIDAQLSGKHVGSLGWTVSRLKSMKLKFVNWGSGTAIQAVDGDRIITVSAIVLCTSDDADVYTLMNKRSQNHFACYTEILGCNPSEFVLLPFKLTDASQAIVDKFVDDVCKEHERLLEIDAKTPINLFITVNEK